MSEITSTKADISSPATHRASDRQGNAHWSAVISLSSDAFALATAEFLPATLLTPIANNLGVSDGIAGQTVSMTAAIAAVAGPALIIGTTRIDRRTLVWGISFLLVLSDLLAAAAPNIWVLLVAGVEPSNRTAL